MQQELPSRESRYYNEGRPYRCPAALAAGQRALPGYGFSPVLALECDLPGRLLRCCRIALECALGYFPGVVYGSVPKRSAVRFFGRRLMSTRAAHALDPEQRHATQLVASESKRVG